MFEVLTAHGEDAARWTELIGYLPYDLRDVYMTPGWGRANEADGATAHLAVSIHEGQGFIVAQPFLKRPIRGTPFCDITALGYGGPVTSSALAARTDGVSFNDEFRAWCRTQQVVSEFYLINPVSASHQQILLPSDGGPRMERGVTLLHLGTQDEIVARMRPNRRQSLRKANGAVVDWCQPANVADVYVPAMRRKNAAPRWQFSLGYFENLKRQLGDNCAMVSSTKDGVVQAVAVFLLGRATAYYHLAATVEHPVSGHADQLILAGAVLAKKRGCDWLHLGGGLTADTDDTLAAYKRSFGGITRPVYSNRRVLDRTVYDALSQGHDPSFFPAYREKEAAS